MTPTEDGRAAETSPGDAECGVASTFSENENHCDPPLPSAAENDVSYTDEFETAGEVPPLEAQGEGSVSNAFHEGGPSNKLDEESVDQSAVAGATIDEESDIIDLLEEVVDAHQEEDNLLSDTAVSEAPIPDVGASEYMSGMDEPVESSSLNTNFVLQDPSEAMMAAGETDPGANETKEELAPIITLQDEIPAAGSFDVRLSIEGVREDSDQIVKELSRESFGDTLLDSAENAVLPGCPVSPGIEECLETVEEVDTNSFEIIELKEEAIVGQPVNDTAKTVTSLMHEPETAPVDKAVDEAAAEPVVSSDAEFLPKEQRREPVDAKTQFERGKLACQRKDYAKAVDSFNRYLELSPNDPRGPYNLAILHYRLKDYTRAAANARKALDLGYTAADRIMAKIKTKTDSEAGSDIAVEKSVSDAWLETETLHDLSLPEPTAESEEKEAAASHRDAGKSPDAVLPMTRAAVLEDNLFEPATVDPSRGAIDPLLSDETASIETAGVT
ncbi:MAG: tetratricopeptide repeat protein, partial [Desulfobacterales bacterium]